MTLGWNTFAEQLRRRADRAARWDPDKRTSYLGYQRAGRELLQLRVWPDEPSGVPAATAPPIDALFDRNEELAYLAPGPVTIAANEVAARADELAGAIAEIRATTGRGTGGAVDPAAVERWDRVRRELALALDRFAEISRRDLAITAPYAAGRR